MSDQSTDLPDLTEAEAEQLYASWYRQGIADAPRHIAAIASLIAMSDAGELPGSLAAECFASCRQGLLSGLHQIARSRDKS